MKNTIKTILALFCSAAVFASCAKEDVASSMITADVTSFADVAYTNPADLAVTITSNVNWIVTTPSWVTPSATYGNGNAIVTFKVDENYENETTTTKPRSGEIKISGGGTLTGDGAIVTIPVSQLGYTYVDPSAPIGNIPSVDEFIDFLKAVSAGNLLTRWTDDNGEIPLTADIDLSGVEDWSPFVKAVNNGNNSCAFEVPAFSGVFNGNGFKITGFNPELVLDAKTTFGLFPITDGAVIKNLEITADVSISSNDQADAGILIGTALNTTVQNVVVNGTFASDGIAVDAKRLALGGVIGFAAATDDKQTLIEKVTSNVECSVQAGACTKNGAGSAMYGGIVGFATTPKDIEGRVIIKDCVNNGDMNVKLGRCSGIVPTANCNTTIEGCTNYGDQINAFVDGRLANIACNVNLNSMIINCVNYGVVDATAEGYKGTAAGILGLFGNASASLEGGANYGTVRTLSSVATDKNSGKQKVGLICADFSSFSYVKDVVVSGGLVIDGASVEINESNYMDYIGFCKDANLSKVTNLTWVAPGN